MAETLKSSDPKFIYLFIYLFLAIGLPWWPNGKEYACQSWRCGFIRGWGRSPGEGNGNPLQYSCLEESDETEQLSAHTHTRVHTRV